MVDSEGRYAGDGRFGNDVSAIVSPSNANFQNGRVDSRFKEDVEGEERDEAEIARHECCALMCPLGRLAAAAFAEDMNGTYCGVRLEPVPYLEEVLGKSFLGDRHSVDADAFPDGDEVG